MPKIGTYNVACKLSEFLKANEQPVFIYVLLTGDYFVPVCCFLLFNLTDYLGRIGGGYTVWVRIGTGHTGTLSTDTGFTGKS